MINNPFTGQCDLEVDGLVVLEAGGDIKSSWVGVVLIEIINVVGVDELILSGTETRVGEHLAVLQISHVTVSLVT